MTAAEQAEQKRYLAAAFYEEADRVAASVREAKSLDEEIQRSYDAVKVYEQAHRLEDEAKRLELESVTVTQKGK